MGFSEVPGYYCSLPMPMPMPMPPTLIHMLLPCLLTCLSASSPTPSSQAALTASSALR